MCMMVHVGSDVPLPRCPWDKEHPAFCVDDVHETQRDVLKHFTTPHVCYVGAHEGCGCGFQSSDNPDDDDPETLAAARDSRARLASFLRRALQDSARLELYACWAGDEGCEPEYRDTLVPEELLSTKMSFREREFLSVVSAR